VEINLWLKTKGVFPLERHPCFPLEINLWLKTKGGFPLEGSAQGWVIIATGSAARLRHHKKRKGGRRGERGLQLHVYYITRLNPRNV